MLNLSHPEIKFAVESVRKASRLVMEVRREMISPAMTKKDKSPVTIADFGSQALVGKFLHDTFPQDSFVAEESSSALQSGETGQALAQITQYVRRFLPGASEKDVCGWIDRGTGDAARRFWTMDPIDGTKGFVRGDQYAVALALIEDGELKVGVLGCPHLSQGCKPDKGGPGSISVAARGQGAWWSPLAEEAPFQPLKVSSRADAAQALLVRSLEGGHTDTSVMDKLVSNIGTKRTPLMMDSLAKYSVVAGGGADFLFRLPSPDEPDRKEWIWDQAAGVILVEEAGGRATDLEGRKLDFSTGRLMTRNRGVIISNGRLHDAALAAVRKLRF